MGAGVDIRFSGAPVTALIIPNTSNLVKVVYSGSITVLAGITIITTTQANSTFLKGKLNLANPYPTMEHIITCSSISVAEYSRELPMVFQ